MHLIPLLLAEIVLVEYCEHVLVKVLLKVILLGLRDSLVNTGSSLTPSELLLSQLLVELLLTATQEKLLKIHLWVLLVVKLLEETLAEADVVGQEGQLRSRLHKDDLH